MPILQREETLGPVRRLHLARAVAGRPVVWGSVYAWDGILFDSGFIHARREFTRWIGKVGARACLTTHEHEDHTGNHAVLTVRRIPTHAPPEVVEHLKTPTRVRLYRRVAWGSHDAAPGVLPIEGGRVEVEGKRFRVIETPGHSWIHVAYQEEETGIAIVGDAYLGKFRATRRVEDVPTQIETLRRLLDLDAPLMLPMHGPALEEPKETLWETIEYLEGLRKRALALHGKGWSVRRITRELIGPEPWITYLSAGEYSSRNVVRQLLSGNAQASP